MATRPTTDRIKETLFNMLQNQIPGRRFLDLFSGSGAIAIEALSRGAREAVLVENQAGALNRITGLFARRAFNIESLAVGTTDDPAISRITIEVLADNAMIEQIMNQLRKQFPVYSVQELLPERSIRRELVMFKVRAETPDIRNEIIQIANIFRASIIDVSLKSLTLALIGDETKAEAMQRLLEAFGILELVRTGMVALERGAYTISDENKEQAEFNLGKNFL